MMIRRVTTAVAIVALSLPFFASAQTADSIKQQIDVLLRQIAALQEQLRNVQAVEQPQVIPIPRACPSFIRALSRGARGSDVGALQTFLAGEGLLANDSITGFFGQLTEQAVQRWQAQNTIVSYGDAVSTGYGVVGVRTRAAISALCSTIPFVPIKCPKVMLAQCTNGTLVSLGTDANGCSLGYRCQGVPGGGTPVINGLSGPTTLSTNETGTWTVNASDPAGGTLSYSIDWGDQYRVVPAASAMTLEQFTQTTTFTHSYSSTGTFTVTVTVQNGTGQSARTTTTVRVGGTSSGDFRVITPNGGESLTVGQPVVIRWNTAGVSLGGDGVKNIVKLSLIPQSSTYKDTRVFTIGNFHASDLSYTWTPPASLAGDSYRLRAVLNNGICESFGSYPFDQVGVCMAISTDLATDESDGWFTIAGGSSSGSFTASPTYGYVPLAVVFTARAQEGPLFVNFGDGQTGYMDVSAAALYPPQWGIGHTYTSPGTYTATLSVGGCGPNASSGCLGPPIRQLGTVTITAYATDGTCTYYPCPVIENEGKKPVVATPEVQALAAKHGWEHVHVKALDHDTLWEDGFVEQIHPKFKGELGCIIMAHSGDNEGWVYVEDKDLKIVYRETIKEFIEKTKNIPSNIMSKFYLAFH